MANIRIARLLRLMALLRGRSARTPGEMAHALSISQRTFYRDMQALDQAGMVCRYDKDEGRYQIGGDFFLPPMQLTLGEAMSLSVLARQFGARGQIPLMEEAWRAVTKIRGQLPAAIREEIAGADGQVRIEGARVSVHPGDDKHFETIRRAIASKRKVRCTYDGSRRGKTPFLFRPYALFFGQRAWYVIGHSEAAGGERSLKLNRLDTLEPTGLPYMIPDGWTLERSLGHAWRMIRGERRYGVRVRFDRECSRNVADTLWHATQRITWPDDGNGGCVFECEVDGLDEILWWLLGYGSHAQVLAPPELIGKVRQTVDEMRGCTRQRTGEKADRFGSFSPLLHHNLNVESSLNYTA